MMMSNPPFRLPVALIVLLLTGLASPAIAASSADLKDVTYSIEPIIGYELQRKTNPDRSKLVLTYGARVIAGYKILSAEGEYTQGKSDEVFTSPAAEIEEKTEKFRAGLRSTYSLGSFLDAHLRAGAEAQKKHTKTTSGGATTESDDPYHVYPYVGTGLGIHVADQISLDASVLATLKDINDLNKTEYSTTLGVKINFNAK